MLTISSTPPISVGCLAIVNKCPTNQLRPTLNFEHVLPMCWRLFFFFFFLVCINRAPIPHRLRPFLGKLEEEVGHEAGSDESHLLRIVDESDHGAPSQGRLSAYVSTGIPGRYKRSMDGSMDECSSVFCRAIEISLVLSVALSCVVCLYRYAEEHLMRHLFSLAVSLSSVFDLTCARTGNCVVAEYVRRFCACTAGFCTNCSWVAFRPRCRS